MELNIQKNLGNQGLYCFFNHNGKEYYADLCFVSFIGSECMIFHSENEQVTSWSELYCKRGIPITPESLRECVEEFVATLEP